MQLMEIFQYPVSLQREWTALLVGLPGDVQEEGDLVGELVAAHIALEGVLVAVVAHVDAVHDLVHEGQLAVRAHVAPRQRVATAAAASLVGRSKGVVILIPLVFGQSD